MGPSPLGATEHASYRHVVTTGYYRMSSALAERADLG